MDKKTLDYELSESIALFRTAKIIDFESQLVKSSEFSILIIIYHSDNKISAVDISNYLNCSKVYVSRLVSLLIQKKYIWKEVNSSDARQLYLHLTDEGKKLVKDCKDKYMETTNYLYEKLGEEKSRILIDLLNESTNILKIKEKEKKL